MTKNKTTSGDRWFSVAAAVTVLWVIFLVALTAMRIPDYWPLFEPKLPSGDAPDPRLTLNEIGDFLAGSFAPLAFLWFFVSTWLQREELKETRLVLSDQQEELKRAAQESAEQTGIMQGQLEAAQARDVYEQHRLRMYYLARFIFDVGAHRSVDYNRDGDEESNLYGIQRDFVMMRKHRNSELTEENASVDAVLGRLADGMREIQGLFKSVQIRHIPDTDELEAFKEALGYVQSEISDLIESDIYKGNALISSRIRGISLQEVNFQVIAVLEWLQASEAASSPDPS